VRGWRVPKRKVTLIALIVGLAGSPDASEAGSKPVEAASDSFTIRASDGYVTAIGAFKIRRDATIAAAQRVFGTPSSTKLTRGSSCKVEWRSVQLRIWFDNYGGHGPGQTTCSPSVGMAQSFTAQGRRFRTWRGLRVRARSDTIPDRHPSAEFRQGSWWLRTAVSPFGDQGEYPVVRAIVSNGRVSALAGWIGAAGE
jgi:hypothetical protein